MKAIVLMFDSLNRRMLSPYGCDWVHAPNFRRLAERTVTFDNAYVGSMPCMPARREFHTARPNFLHRSWSPLEPFDDSMPRLLKEAGITTHLISDHYHYWETGGATYHTQYSTWQAIRGQEGDLCLGQIEDPLWPAASVGQCDHRKYWHRQDRVNRAAMRREEDQPQSLTFRAGLDFLERNHAGDNWMLHLETFDPHEPYFSPRRYKDLYAEHYRKYKGPAFDWPAYRAVTETPEEVEHLRHENAALVSMCDAKLGDLLDAMDRHDLWRDTLLVVWTDHGFCLGEHNCWAKCWLPFYDEIAHTPFFVWDPRSGARGERRRALVQPALDLPPTLLRFFGQEPTADMLGADLAGTVARDAAVRDAAIFGVHGGHVNVTDGRHVYMRGPATAANQPLFDYTLMPTHMREMFKPEELRGATLVPPFGFTKGCPVLRIPARAWPQPEQLTTRLYDLDRDPGQAQPVCDAAAEARMTDHLVRLMRACEAPVEQYQRLGLPASG